MKRFFHIDNQLAFKYGAMEEFGMRDDRMEEGEEVISRKTIDFGLRLDIWWLLLVGIVILLLSKTR